MNALGPLVLWFVGCRVGFQPAIVLCQLPSCFQLFRVSRRSRTRVCRGRLPPHLQCLGLMPTPMLSRCCRSGETHSAASSVCQVDRFAGASIGFTALSNTEVRSQPVFWPVGGLAWQTNYMWMPLDFGLHRQAAITWQRAWAAVLSRSPPPHGPVALAWLRSTLRSLP